MAFSGIDVALYNANQTLININVNKENNNCTANFTQLKVAS